MDVMDVRVLGPLEVARDGAPLRLGSRMQRRLLALLLVSDAPVSSERAIDVLWEGRPPPSAASGLHAYVSRLRALLGEDAPIESGPPGYRLRLPDDALDAVRFERMVGDARRRLADAPDDAADGLAAALGLWRGPAYAEFAAEAFARAEAARLDELRLEACEDAFAARLACDDPGLVADLEAFAREHPLRERAHAQLIVALARAGRQAEALEAFQRVRARLADELGLEPSVALRQAQADVLRQSPSVASAPPPANAPTAPGNLPRPVSGLVGREKEAAEVDRRLQDGGPLTLTGAGGVGKTRLALHAAATAADRHPDGVWWCDLAPVDAGAVDHAVARIVGARSRGDREVGDAVVATMAGKRALLVLDNCEHVAEAAARLAERVARGSPRVTLLATSREPLGIDGEQAWQVPPLPVEGADDAGQGAAVQLFAARARGHLPGFTLDAANATAVADVCRRLDGLPLAIELAAALVPALGPDEIARRLDQRFGLLTHGPRKEPRHRSLDAVVGWSYQLLEPDEQRLFDRLAVFAGSCSLDAIEAVCPDERLPAGRVAGLLAGLVGRSMVEVDRAADPPRYRLLETLREYAAQRLAERGEDPTLRARHAAWCVALAERADADVRGAEEAAGVAVLEAELPDLRAAHRWAVAHDEADLALRLAVALYAFARFRLRDEPMAWAEEAAALPSAEGHPLRAMVRGIAAHGLSDRGALDRARELAAHALAEAAEDQALFAPLRVLSSVALYEGRLADCREHTRRATAAAQRTGDAYSLTWARMHEALALVYGGDREAGLAAALELRRAADALGNPTQRAWARYAEAEARGDDDPDAALGLLEEAIAIAEPVQGRYLEGVARVAMLSLLARHSRPREALASFPAVIEHWRRAGDWVHQWTTLRNLVPLLVRLSADAAAAQLLGALRAADTAAPVFGEDADRLAEARGVLAARLGSRALHELLAAGERLDGARAVELALTSVDGALGRNRRV